MQSRRNQPFAHGEQDFRERSDARGSFQVATIHPPTSVPVALNGYSLWLVLMVGLTVVNYGFPIAQLLALKNTSVPAVYVGAGR